MKKYFVEVSEEETNASVLRSKYYDSVEECYEFVKNISYLAEWYHMAIHMIMNPKGDKELDNDIEQCEILA